VVWHAMLTPAQDAHAVVALQHVYQTERSRYEPLILQLPRWWRRVPSGCGGSNIIVQHAGIIELIARFALPVPFLLGVPQVHPRPAVREAWFDDGVQEGEPEPVNADPLIETYAQLEPVADIDPAEAAAVAEECWASAVEALCAGRGTTSPRGNDLEVVVLTFGRDGLAFDNALLTSPPALRAVELGVDIKPGWANGAKVFVPGLSATDVAEIRVDLLPRHVVALASDVQQILEALTSLPSRSRPRLKAGKPAVPILVRVTSHSSLMSVAAAAAASTKQCLPK